MSARALVFQPQLRQIKPKQEATKTNYDSVKLSKRQKPVQKKTKSRKKSQEVNGTKRPAATHVFIDLGPSKENQNHKPGVHSRQCSKDLKKNTHQKSTATAHNTSIGHSLLSRTVVEETEQVPAAEVGKYLLAINDA